MGLEAAYDKLFIMSILKSEKVCKQCNQRLSTKEFYKQKQKSSDNLTTWEYFDTMCKSCRSKYTSDRRKIRKIEIIEYLGGQCVDCGLKSENTEVFDCHHLDGATKDFSIGQTSTRSFKSVKNELDKCILLCACCHRIRHASK